MPLIYTKGSCDIIFYENESYLILPPQKPSVGHILNKIIMIKFFKPAPFSYFFLAGHVTKKYELPLSEQKFCT